MSTQFESTFGMLERKLKAVDRVGHALTKENLKNGKALSLLAQMPADLRKRIIHEVMLMEEISNEGRRQGIAFRSLLSPFRD